MSWRALAFSDYDLWKTTPDDLPQPADYCATPECRGQPADEGYCQHCLAIIAEERQTELMQEVDWGDIDLSDF